jgi:hypothetical protein
MAERRPPEGGGTEACLARNGHLFPNSEYSLKVCKTLHAISGNMVMLGLHILIPSIIRQYI